MRTIYTLIKKDLLEIKRTKKLIIMLFMFLFVALISPITAKMMPEIFKSLGDQTPGITINIPTPTAKDAIDQFEKNISQLVLLILIFVFAGAISDEKTKKNLQLLIPKPVSRESYIISKFITYIAALKLNYILASIVFVFYTYSLFGSFPLVNFIIIAALTLLFIITLLTITMSVSALVKNAFLASGAGIFALFISSLIPVLFTRLEKYSPGYVLSKYGEIINNGWSNDFIPSVMVSIILIFLFILIAILSFKNQEID